MDKLDEMFEAGKISISKKDREKHAKLCPDFEKTSEYLISEYKNKKQYKRSKLDKK